MVKKYSVRLWRKQFIVVTDRFLLLKVFQEIRDRSWGLVGMFGMAIGFGICFIITPELLSRSTAFSDFGGDVRTAPFFSGSIFFCAYGFWRWRRYLESTFKHPAVATTLLTLAIIGLYLIALMPVTIDGVVEIAHNVGFALTGTCMALIVLLDTFLVKVTNDQDRILWQLLKLESFLAIVLGFAVTAVSIRQIGILDAQLVGETMLFMGFFGWVLGKTIRGEGVPSTIAKTLRKALVVK